MQIHDLWKPRGRARFDDAGAAHAFRSAALIGGASALAMYWLDPASGRRRRVEAADRIRSTCYRAIGQATRRGISFSKRLRGALAEASRAFREDVPPDDVLEARVRSRIGLACPSAPKLEVRARRGMVELVGTLPWEDHDAVVAAARAVPGARSVVARLRPTDGERVHS